MTTVTESVPAFPIATPVQSCPRCGGPAKSFGTCEYEGRERELFVCAANPQCVGDVVDPREGGIMMRNYPVEFVIVDGQLVRVQPGGDHD